MSVRNFRVHVKRGDPFTVLLDSRLKNETVLFESGAVAELGEAEVEARKRDDTYEKVTDAYGCLGVLQIERNFQYLVLVTSCMSVGKVLDSEVYKITGTTFISLNGKSSDDDKVSGVQKLFNSGAYYFAQSASQQQYDLTLCVQRRLQEHATDNRFFWNRSLYILFERYGIPTCDWLVKCICGGIEMRTIYSGNKQAKACVISRLSCERAGTRFNTRGTNDDGHVANFVETEQVIFLDDIISSYVQIRGSVPLFWEQPGVNVGSHKVKISRGYEACAPAFERHLDNLQQHYGQVSLINLMGRKEGESMLSEMFQEHLKASPVCRNIPYKHFDYHTHCPRGQTAKLSSLVETLHNQFEEFGFFHYDGQEVSRQQKGCFRINCVDCLDRTNAVQAYFAAHVLSKQLELLGLSDKPQMVSRFEMVYGPMWQSNGDSISKIYAGTGAMTVGKSKYRDVTTSATRAIQNNFLDSSKQDAINLLLLGSRKRTTLDDAAYTLQLTDTMHASNGLIEKLISHHKEYTTDVNLRVCLATWNVNGGTHYRSIAFKHESRQLNDWLQDMYPNSLKISPETCDVDGEVDVTTDIFAIGFEEIVDLTAKNITSASTTNQKTWGAELEKTISRDHKYILITSSQLVGVCLFVFVRPHLAPYIRDVAVANVKTGLGGTTGNKGAVAIRFMIYNTSMCYVCAHFAAGQSGVKERNEDFSELSTKLTFPLGGTLKHHDYVFWVGDFNYRIDLPKSEAERLIKDGNWKELLAADQLTKQKAEGNVFQGYEEGVPYFAPTYKYDLFCDDYDTSEKARVPSWTDRCLWRRSKLVGSNEMWSAGRLLVYNRAELKTSDHRPVSALLDLPVLKVDGKLKNQVLERVVQEEGPTDGTVVIANSDSSVISDESVSIIVHMFSEVGQLTLIRFVENNLVLTFVNGRHAVEAANLYDNYMINSLAIRVKLKMSVWKDNIQNELKRDSSSQSTFYSPFTNDLLGDDFKHRSMSFDIQDDEELGEVEDSLLGLTTSTSSTLSPSPSPVPSGRSTPENILNGPTEPAKVPPPRPNKPPSRPPPPKKIVVPPSNIDLLTGSPSPKANAVMPDLLSSVSTSDDSATPSSSASSSSAMTISQPELICHSTMPLQPVVARPKPVGAAGSSKKRVGSVIGVPTNVSHSGAKSEDEARKLIENLMMGQSIDQPELPAPLLPAANKPEPKVKTEPTRPPLPKSISQHVLSKSAENYGSEPPVNKPSGNGGSRPDVTIGLSGLQLGSSTRNSIRPPPPIPARQKEVVGENGGQSSKTLDPPQHSSTTDKPNDISENSKTCKSNDVVSSKQARPAVPPRQKSTDNLNSNSVAVTLPVTATPVTETPPVPAQRHAPPIPTRQLPPRESTNQSACTKPIISAPPEPPKPDITSGTPPKRIPPVVPKRTSLPPS